MRGLLVRRLASGVALLCVLSLLSFAFAELAPGDPLALLRLDPQVAPQLVDELETRYGAGRPLLERYGLWLRSMMSGEFGYSVVYRRPVGELLGRRLGNTLLLVAAAFLLGWTGAVLPALLAARSDGGQKPGWVDRGARLAAAGLVAIPRLLIALAGLWLAAALDAVPLGGMHSLGAEAMSRPQRLLDLLRHLALPAVVLALAVWPTLYLHARQAVAEALEAPHLDAALARGLRRRRWLWAYLLPAASNPLISLLPLSLTTLLSASLLVEVVLGWPGMGPLLLEAILGRDLHVVLASVLVSGALLVLGQLIADLLLLLSDPRLRLARTS